MLATNALHEMAEQLKVNCDVLNATLKLTPKLDEGIRLWIESSLEKNGDKIVRAHQTIDEIETLASEGDH